MGMLHKFNNHFVFSKYWAIAKLFATNSRLIATLAFPARVPSRVFLRQNFAESP